MSLIFMGTPEWAIPSLKALIDSDIKISAVFTQPDRRTGRKKKLIPSPIKQYAEKKRIKVIIIETPTDVQKRNELNEFLENYGFVTTYIVRNSTKLTEYSESAFNRYDKTPLNMLAIRSDLTDQLNTVL